MQQDIEKPGSAAHTQWRAIAHAAGMPRVAQLPDGATKAQCDRAVALDGIGIMLRAYRSARLAGNLHGYRNTLYVSVPNARAAIAKATGGAA